MKTTTHKKKIIAVIPARYASTRFPGKPLAKIKGRSMIEWVIEGTLTSQLIDRVMVATDDERIAEVVEKMNIPVAMTASHLSTGTDRIYQASKDLDFDVVLNIQGDEPLINKDYIDPLANIFLQDETLDMATLAHPLDEFDLENKNAVKVIVNKNHEAIYFSRFPIPYSREKFLLSQGPDGLHQPVHPFCQKHIGLYGYSKSFLKTFCQSEQADIEKAESLEQLRALYLGARIKVLQVARPTFGVDTPEDLAKVELLFK